MILDKQREGSELRCALLKGTSRSAGQRTPRACVLFQSEAKGVFSCGADLNPPSVTQHAGENRNAVHDAVSVKLAEGTARRSRQKQLPSFRLSSLSIY